MDEVLSGIKVLEFGQYIAGPYTASLLAEQGAEVIKVEQPGGDPYRLEPGFAVCNRSKKAITLNLKSEKGREAALRLAGDADVIIENFRPDVAERLGIGYEEIRAVNPRVVYCSISGFGRRGPYKEVPGWEPLVLSLSTIYAGEGRTGDPVYQNLQVASHFASFLASFYIVMALYAREDSGKGDRIDLSLLKSVVAMQPNILGNSPYKFFMPFTVRGVMPLVRIYQGSDGKWFVLNAASVPFFTALCTLLGHEEWLVDPLFEGSPYFIMPPRNAQVAALLQDIFYTKTRDEWVSLLQGVSVPTAPTQPVEQFLKHPHLKLNNFIVDIEQPGLGRVRQPAHSVTLSTTPGSVKGAAPALGQHTREVLAGIGYSAAAIDALVKESAA
jgi:crotonobetainyl-CoA:carnitine CoA-transferase CaiB-like acyl-CoA transferase